MSQNKKIILACFVVIGAASVWYYYIKQNPQTYPKNGQISGPQENKVEENFLQADDQKPGNTVIVKTVNLIVPGYVVVYEDKNGAPGGALNTSPLLKAGANSNVPVLINLVPGKSYYAALHRDNGDGYFSSVDEDTIIKDAVIVKFFVK